MRRESSGLSLSRRVRGLVALAAVSLWLVSGMSPAGAVHERTVGQTYYSDGTTAKTATRGTTLTIYATGVSYRANGVDGGVFDYDWLVTVGKRDTTYNIPCYNPHYFVDGVAHQREGTVIPNASFEVPSWLPSGTWEVCFYSQPYDYVTAPVYLAVVP